MLYRITSGDRANIHCVVQNSRYIFLAVRLDALDPKAYKAFQASNDLQDVVQRVLGGGGDDDDGRPSLKKGISVRASLMTPVKPMLVSGAVIL